MAATNKTFNDRVRELLRRTFLAFGVVTIVRVAMLPHVLSF